MSSLKEKPLKIKANNNVTESINSADELRGFTKGILNTTKDVFLHVVQNDAKETERLFEMMQPIINDLNKDNPDRTVILRYETESSMGKYAAIGASAGVLIGGGVALTLVAVGAITGPFFAVILGGVVIGALVGAAIGAITGLMNRKKVIVLTINSSGVVSKKTVDRRKLAVSQVQRG